MTSIDTASAFAGATNDKSPSAKFYAVGDKYHGQITRVGEHTGPNDFSGKEETSVTIDLLLAAPVSTTNPKDGAVHDFAAGDTVTIWARTHIEADVVVSKVTGAIADAVRKAGQSGLPQVGGTLAVQYVGDGTPSKAGHNPPKLFKAQYAPPTGTPSSQAGGPFDTPAPAPVQQAPQAPAAPAPAGTDDELF